MRRATRARAKIRELRAYRLCVYRTPRHIYAQVIDPDGGNVIASASTVEKELRKSIAGHLGNVSAAAAIGKTIAERAKSAGVEKVAFDRSGFRFHGRVKALANAARENGLDF
jgi:large subunit ribosomal protein L18